MKDAPLLNLTLAIVLAFLIGALLIIGRPILLPIMTAIIAVYIMLSTSRAMQQLPVIGILPLPVIRFLVMLVFALAITFFAIIIAATVREISSVAPVYEANLDAMFHKIADRFDFDSQDIWDELRAVTIDRIDLNALVLSLLGSFTNVSAAVFLVVIYAAFLMAERADFEHKIKAALGNEAQAEKTLGIVAEINTKISDYLAIKTLINIILGAVSFVVLWAMGIDFAMFWAIAIALLNYIPYVGSYLGVMFPVALSLAQFGSLGYTIALTLLLVGCQFVLGNIVEPKMIGRQMNLSPFVVLIALSVWIAIWGIPGAIFAIPMTSIMAIVLAGFDSTRFMALLLAERVDQEGA
ncbi:MAG: AI-2E family transporter [Arenibacterium sp.]